MEPTHLVSTIIEPFFQSDVAFTFAALGLPLETAYALGEAKVDPARIPTNILVGGLFMGVAALGLYAAGIESPAIINGAFPIGYMAPSIYKLVENMITHERNSREIIPPAITLTAVAGIGLINALSGPIGLYEFAQVEKAKKAIDFFGNALRQFGNQLPALTEKIHRITK